MSLTPAQIKGRLKNLAKQNNADARILMRIFMMERFLERVAVSEYAENFIIKGGILVTSMIGTAMRSTMDIDTSIRSFDLSEENAERIVKDICAIELDDDVHFEIKEVSRIMDAMEYPGIRLALDAVMGMMVTPIKIDISTGDAITPGAVEYSYKLMLEDRRIQLWSYNLETILAEKLQTVLARGLLNTRMRDYYDINMLLLRYGADIKTDILQQAFSATCRKRESLNLISEGRQIPESIIRDENLKQLWESYRKKYSYAAGVSFDDAVNSVRQLLELAIGEPNN